MCKCGQICGHEVATSRHGPDIAPAWLVRWSVQTVLSGLSAMDRSRTTCQD
jgi:hypothetical protein